MNLKFHAFMGATGKPARPRSVALARKKFGQWDRVFTSLAWACGEESECLRGPNATTEICL